MFNITSPYKLEHTTMGVGGGWCLILGGRDYWPYLWDVETFRLRLILTLFLLKNPKLHDV